MGPGMISVIVVVVLVLMFGGAIIGLYNALVSARQRVRESWSNVDTELQRRHSLIPNLVNTVQGYMTHERELLENITSLRARAMELQPGEPTGEQSKIESQLGAALGQLRVQVENYPDLKASQNFLSLQGELANTEDRIQAALRFFNGNVRDLNIKCEQFPSVLIASVFGFQKAEYFELADEAARETPVVQF
ncbi:MAG: LemA family protein [Planctomycetota bacterium]